LKALVCALSVAAVAGVAAALIGVSWAINLKKTRQMVDSELIRLNQATPTVMQEERRLAGGWQVILMLPQQQPIVHATATFEHGKMLTTDLDGRKKTHAFRLNPDALPKQIDLDFEGRTCRGIYRLDNTSVLMWYGDQTKPRIKTFDAGEESLILAIECRRIAP
jgi:uncharacterized protein (TIGR03067 family)